MGIVDINNKLKNINILVTGNKGYLGSSLVKKLNKIDCRLFLFDGDVSIRKDWERNIDNEIDVVFHLAGVELKNSYQSVKELEEEWRANCLSLLHLADICIKNPNIKIVFTSSTNVFGNNNIDIVSESSISSPMGVWAAHKLLSENYLNIYHNIYGVKSVILRLPNVYGPTANSNTVERMMINKVIKIALETNKLILFNNNDCIRDFLFIDDVINALLMTCFLDDELYNGKCFILGSNQKTTIKDIWYIISRCLGNVPIEIDENYEIHPIEMRSYTGDYSAYNSLTGWEPKISLVDGIYKTISYFQK
tara:strand:+ start:3038 stop:3958 length:921 start_codon:yes stop_codon:yes gene_type:complete